MKVNARPVTGQKGTVELLVDGKAVSGVRCKPGSARISRGMIEFTATVQVPPYEEKVRKSNKNEQTFDKDTGERIDENHY